MSDMRGTGAREMEPTSSKSKVLAAFIVAIGVGAAGAYVYTSNGGVPQKQQLAMNEPVPLTPPPPAATSVATTPQSEKAPATDATPPPAQTTAPAAPAKSPPLVQRVARVKTRAEQPAPTPPDTTAVPDVPAQTVTPPAAPAPVQTAPPTETPQATPETSQQPQSDQSTPQ